MKPAAAKESISVIVIFYFILPIFLPMFFGFWCGWAWFYKFVMVDVEMANRYFLQVGDILREGQGNELLNIYEETIWQTTDNVSLWDREKELFKTTEKLWKSIQFVTTENDK